MLRKVWGALICVLALAGAVTAPLHGGVTPVLFTAGVSANCATIPPQTTLTDISSNVWTVVSGVIYKNGVTAGFSASVTLLLYYNGTIYQENSSAAWWSWNGTGWTSIGGDPRGSSCGGGSSSSSSSSGASSSSGSGSSSGSSGGTSLLAYLNSLRGVNMLSGQHFDDFAPSCGGTYGCSLDQFLPATGATPANITVNDHSSGNTGKAPAILGVYFSPNGTGCGSEVTTAQGVAVANGQLAAGGIVLASFIPSSPAAPNCYTFGGTGADWPGVITPGNAYNNTILYGRGCTAVSPCGGMWAFANALKALTPGHKVLVRILWENNLGLGSWWFGTGGVNGTNSSGSSPASNAQFLTLYKQCVDYLRAQGVTNALFGYVTNYFSGAYSNNDPGPSYRDWVGMDMYGPTTQAGVLSNLSNAGGGMPYLNGLGVPVLLSEIGDFSFNNGVVSQFTYSNNIWNQALQANASNLVGSIIFTQNWALGVQLNAAAYMNNTIQRAALPALINKLIAPRKPIWSANDDHFEPYANAA